MIENGSSDGRIYIHDFYAHCGTRKRERIDALTYSGKPLKRLFTVLEGSGWPITDDSSLNGYDISSKGIEFCYGCTYGENAGTNLTYVFKTWFELQKEIDRYGLPTCRQASLVQYGLTLEEAAV